MRRVPIDTTVSALVIMPGRRALRPTRAPSQWNAGADVRSRSVGIWQVGDLGNDKSMSQLRRRRERRWSVGIDLRARVVSIQPKNTKAAPMGTPSATFLMCQSREKSPMCCPAR